MIIENDDGTTTSLRTPAPPAAAEHTITKQRIADLLTCAFEGGSAYWAVITRYVVPPGPLTFRSDPDRIYRSVDYPLNEGGAVILETNELDEINGQKEWTLDFEAIKKGLVPSPGEIPASLRGLHRGKRGQRYRRRVLAVMHLWRRGVVMKKSPLEVLHQSSPSLPNQISMYLHCGKCLQEIMKGPALTASPKEYARTQAGITPEGYIQVWCNRHECNVSIMKIQPRGQRLSNAATETRAPKPGANHAKNQEQKKTRRTHRA